MNSKHDLECEHLLLLEYTLKCTSNPINNVYEVMLLQTDDSPIKLLGI